MWSHESGDGADPVGVDLATRMVVGWQLAEHMRTSLVIDALQMAITHGHTQPGAVFHSDHGAQGEFNRSSQHLDHGGVRWAETRSWSGCPKGYGGSGRRIGHCDRRCVRRVDLS